MFLAIALARFLLFVYCWKFRYLFLQVWGWLDSFEEYRSEV